MTIAEDSPSQVACVGRRVQPFDRTIFRSAVTQVSVKQPCNAQSAMCLQDWASALPRLITNMGLRRETLLLGPQRETYFKCGILVYCVAYR